MTSQEQVTRKVRVMMALRAEGQGALAEALACSRQAVSLKLLGRSRWSMDDLDALAAHFGVRPEVLVAPDLGGLAEFRCSRPLSPSGDVVSTPPTVLRSAA